MCCMHASAATRSYRLPDICAGYGLPPPAINGKTASSAGARGSLSVEDGSRLVSINGVSVWLNEPVRASSGVFILPQGDVSGTLDPLLSPPARRPRGRKWVVVLDPGHGGSDTGAISPRKVFEKKATLDIAKRVSSHLRGLPLDVRLTRERDRDTPLAARTALAAQANADIFVSIHMNSAQNRTAAGVETYICASAGYNSTAGGAPSATPVAGNAFDSGNVVLAHAIQKEMLRATSADDRGVRRARFAVLTSAPCPAVLVECAFLSNPGEEAKIITRQYRGKAAEGIAMGIRAYAGL